MTEPGDLDDLLHHSGEYVDPVLPFDWKNLPHEPVGPYGHRARAA